MKLIVPLGILMFVLSFCGITDQIQQQIKDATDSSSGDSTSDTTETTSDSGAETPDLTSAQKEIQDNSTEVEWEDQGIRWKLPDGWNKMDVKKESFNYGSPATGFLIGTISVMPANFPSETSLEATYNSALEQLKNGKYESARYLEIDGVKGVEWIEAMPEESDSPRRHQWIAFRNYQGQNQQLNIMVSTNGDKFGDRKDTFAAIMYSMEINK
ncbi:MAG: hypothetical protein DWQ47_00840 [Acidobacteria bacterium]|nr:MAG: hypothetical protein DWQ32_11300 [Acidobacteriota bacterium]REK04051.1 MAG: hypothetical protein DWQ38_00825 [Acidobacteriota bacterium]REK15213.1 MAG: hypothetical protein DWQ43_16990 [Acidobacteriota bacterium]REK46303.1 MAG: hypothetical protein DWQ47_00840 [Acidobacteriota bacterium]